MVKNKLHLYNELIDSLNSRSKELKEELLALSKDERLNVLEAINEGDKDRLINYLETWLPIATTSVCVFLTYKLIKNFDTIINRQ